MCSVHTWARRSVQISASARFEVFFLQPLHWSAEGEYRGRRTGCPVFKGTPHNLCLCALQSLYRSAERKYGTVSEALDGQMSEGAKLAQRLAAAEEQYDVGLRKLTATAKQIASLQSQASA